MADKRKIARNSLSLYMRMLVTVPLALYISRIVLLNLGIDGYGIFSVVGGIAVIFAFFNNALTVSSQRFITVSISRDSVAESRKVFSMSVNCHLLICLLMLILSETAGLWLINCKLNIPAASMHDANIVYQCALIVTLMEVMNTPLLGAIIAHEKMSFYSISSIADIVLKFGAAFAIGFLDDSRLVTYSCLLLGNKVVIVGANLIYCRTKFDICRYVVSRSKKLFRHIMSFTGWNVIKMAATMSVSQGNNIIVNIFGGPVASAAISISNQVFGNTSNFMLNVETAFNPSITKSLAHGEFKEANGLIYLCSKFAFLLLCLVGLPLVLQMDHVLRVWLKTVPDGTATLCVWSILSVAFDALTGPFNVAIFANGKIKKYQLITTLIMVSSLPAAWFMLKSGCDYQYIFIPKIATQIIALGYALIYTRAFSGFEVGSFVVKRIVIPFVVVAAILMGGRVLNCYLNFSFVVDILITFCYTTLLLTATFFFFGMNKTERSFLINKFRKS